MSEEYDYEAESYKESDPEHNGSEDWIDHIPYDDYENDSIEEED